MKKAIEDFIKGMLRKWLKKKLHRQLPTPLNNDAFKWVFNAPLSEWRDRIWVAKHTYNFTTHTLEKEWEYLNSKQN